MAHRDVGHVLRDLDAEVSDLRAIVDVMKGALAATVVESVENPAWAKPLTPQQRALMGALLEAAPNGVDRRHLLDCLPSLDHVVERNPQLVTVVVARIRRLFGPDAIETLHRGYRLSDEFHAQIRALRALSPSVDKAAAKLGRTG